MPSPGSMHSQRVKRFLTGTVILLSLAILAVFIGYRYVLDRHGDLVSSISGDAQVSLAGIRQTATRDGVTEWTLTAGSAEYIEAGQVAVLTQPAVTFFLQDGGEIRLTADQARLKTDSKDIEVADNVVMHHADYRLSAENLYYEHKDHVIITEAPVSISGDSFSLRADSMIWDLNTSQILLKGSVEGTFLEKS